MKSKNLNDNIEIYKSLLDSQYCNYAFSSILLILHQNIHY